MPDGMLSRPARSSGRRPTLWQATGFIFGLLGIGLSAAKGERPKELRDKS